MFCESPENLRRLLLVLSQGMVARGLCAQALRGRLCVICLGSHAGTAARKDAEHENFMKWLNMAVLSPAVDCKLQCAGHAVIKLSCLCE